MKAKISSSILLLIALFLFSGCVKFFTIGENKGYCEENGCDYSDAGLCADPYEVYQHRFEIKDEPYANIDCPCGKKKSTTYTYKEVIK